jgi:hypothetical protein
MVRALAGVDRSAVWVVQADSPFLTVYRPTLQSWQVVPNPEHLRTLHGGQGELLGANDTAVFAVSSVTGRAEPILTLHSGVELITSVASSEGTLWVSTSTAEAVT